MIVLKELGVYTKENLEKKFKLFDVNINDIIEELEKNKIVKYNSKGEIQFIYVGVIIISGKVIFVLPKYTDCKNKEQEKIVLKNILKLFNNFSERENLYNSDIEDIELERKSLENNLISIINFLLEDYIDYGIYQNEIYDIEFNGNGDINWDLTINGVDPLVIDNQWIYTDFYTNINKVDNKRYITLLHWKIINDCINFINESGLNEILDYNLTSIDKKFDKIEDIDKVNYEISKELRIQFNDRKRRVLLAIRAYIEGKTEVNDTTLLLYGTRNFKWVWEVICSYVFDNKFLAQNNRSKYEVFGINPPIWNIGNNKIANNDNQNHIQMKKNRLTPDIISLFDMKGKRYMLLLDAKYYKLTVGNDKIEGNPGISDISKQYLYEMVLREYVKNNNIDEVFNAFLLPNYSKTYLQGDVSLDFMENYDAINIKLIQLQVSEIIDLYCNHRRYTIEKILRIFN